MGRTATTMTPYGAAAESGVAAWEDGPGWIHIRFHSGGTYRYDASRPGARKVREMQRLARAGDGLNTYINRFVRDNYAARLD